MSTDLAVAAGPDVDEAVVIRYESKSYELREGRQENWKNRSASGTVSSPQKKALTSGDILVDGCILDTSRARLVLPEQTPREEALPFRKHIELRVERNLPDPDVHRRRRCTTRLQIPLPGEQPALFL